MIVAIDGPAASGKSTVARLLAARLGSRYVDTGAMYRAVTLKAIEAGVPAEDEEALATLADTLAVAFEDSVSEEGVAQRVLLDGRDVTVRIRMPDVTAAVSAVSAVPRVRAAMVRRQRELGAGDSVVEGRDIGTVVFPDAGMKVFLTASRDERARRRQRDFAAAGTAVDQGKVRRDIARRDGLDSSREQAPLARAADAVEIDTTGRTAVDVVAEILRIMHRSENGG